MSGHGSPKVNESTFRSHWACPPHCAVSCLKVVGWRHLVDQAGDGEVDGQTDMEKRPKLALTKWREVPVGQERERLEPSQTNTFIRCPAPPRAGSKGSPVVILARERRTIIGKAIMHVFPPSSLLLLPLENLFYGGCYSQLCPRRLSATD